MNSQTELTWKSGRAAAAAYLGTTLHAGVIAGAALSVMMASILKELGWSRAAIGAAITFNYWGSAISAAIAGPFVDRIGPRRIIIPLSLLSGLLTIALGFVGRSLPLFYLIFFLLGAAVPGAIGYSKLLSGWFLRRRGTALSGLGVGIFLATTLAPPASAYLLKLEGWRGAFIILGIAIAVLLFPALIAFAHEKIRSVQSDAFAAESDPDGAPIITAFSAAETESISTIHRVKSTSRRRWRSVIELVS
jgi:MFS family permease